MNRELASLWIGDTLSEIEIASIHSFLRYGHKLVVYGYGVIGNLPADVEFRDASTILPSGRIVRHRRSGSPALHSDLFRYALMQKTEQIWVDLDMIALKPFVFDTPFVFGFENATGAINCAVLRMPPDSAALRELLKFNEDTVAVPPLLTGFRKWKYWLRGWGRGLPIDAWPWGSIGPHALTHFLNQSGEVRYAMPLEAFYFIPIDEMQRFILPGALKMEQIPDAAYGLHLWGGLMRTYLGRHHAGRVPEGSFLSDLLEQARKDGLRI